ncbi:MAG: cellulase family glycosylhydrolase [Treponema sp.]|nr:cellulase family glycosylhydrolase [Treponema sp.]
MKNEKKSGYNEDDMAKYAKCVNELAVENQIATFLWDCSTHMNRKQMKISFPKYIDAIMSCYPKKADFGNGGNDSVFEEEDAKTAVANFGAGWNLGNTLDATSFNISKLGTDEELGWIPKWGEKDSNGNYYPSNWETAWGQPETNEKIVDFILDAGFNAIRIPITWAEHFDENDNIDQMWMNRVKETVDLFYNKGVYYKRSS